MPKKRKQTPGEEYASIWQKQLDQLLGSQIATAKKEAQQRDHFEHLPADEKQDILHRAEGQAALYAIKVVESFVYQSRKKYKDQIDLIQQTDYWPRKWMLDDKQIATMLAKHPLVAILNTIENHIVDLGDDETRQALAGVKYKVPSTNLHQSFMAFWGDQAFYRDLQEATGKSRRVLNSYLQELKDIGAVVRWKRVNGTWLYGFGHWQKIPNSGRRPNRVRFLTEATHKEKLRNFALPWQRRHRGEKENQGDEVVERQGNSVDRSDTTSSPRGAKLPECFSKQTRSAPHNENRKFSVTSQPQKTGLRCNFRPS